MTTFPTELAVYISGTRCGLIREDRHGALSFEYDPEYRGIPLSLSMRVDWPVTGTELSARISWGFSRTTSQHARR